MTAEIVAVGTELLLGDIVDTNSAELGKVLAEFGIDCHRRQTVGDNLARVSESIGLALSRSDIVLTIGGLGPTSDDLTRDGIAVAMGDTLIHDAAIEAELRSKLESRGVRFTDIQSRQAMRPISSRAIDNPNGTAPGLLCQKDGKTIIALPGPRLEFVPMVRGPVSEFFASLSNSKLVSRTLKIVGIGESLVERELADLMELSDPTVAPYAKTGEVHLRITSRVGVGTDASDSVASTEAVVRSRIAEFVYGADGETLESVVLSLLRSQGETFAVAESCTGGGLGGRVTSVPGSSDVFLGGVISYSNDLKVSLLGVSSDTLAAYGAVSEQCAREMAEGVRSRTGASLGVSITGIAGPDGGTVEKPVGLVYIGVSLGERTDVHRAVFHGGREGVRERSVQAALAHVWRRLR